VSGEGSSIKQQQEQAAIVQANWLKLYKAENKAWESAWPTAYRPAFAGFLAGVRAVVNKEPRLLTCPDLAVRLIECAGLGLLPHFGPRGEAVIMYASGKNGPSAALVVGYKGYEAVWYRDGIVKPGGMKVDARMPGDRWEYEETEEGTRFRWTPDFCKPRKYEDMILVFARAVLREGGCAIGIRMKDKCDEVSRWAQGRGQGGPAYKSWPLEMAMKGAIMELKRILPFGENTERALEYEAQHGDSEERDMGDAVRVENVRPITIQAPAALPEPAIRETIEPPTAREVEVVPAAKPEAQAKKSFIVDESTTPDSTAETVATWPDTAEDSLSQWEGTDELIPRATYDGLVAEVQRLPRGKDRAAIGRRIEAVGKRGFAAQREPGAEG